MFFQSRSESLNQPTSPHLATASHSPYIRGSELDAEARYGIIIALAISSGALFVACIGIMIAMCDWRLRYLRLRKELDERGYKIGARLSAQQETTAGDAQGADTQAASGAL
jgi:hypothetical protein